MLKISDRQKKVAEKFGGMEKKLYLCTRIKKQSKVKPTKKFTIMEYEMKSINAFAKVDMRTLKSMGDIILSYLRGSNAKQNLLAGKMTERARQYFTWGARNFRYIVSDELNYGIQFNVSGMLHKGRVRIYYNRATDYFHVELLKARKDELVWGMTDIDCFQLHNVLHRKIERTDDPEV